MIRFNSKDNGGNIDLCVEPIYGSVKIGGGHNDLNRELVPVARKGIAKNGECLVEVEDQSDYSKTLAELQNIRSKVGHGTFNITGEVESFEALVDVFIQGGHAQLVKLKWKGSIN